MTELEHEFVRAERHSLLDMLDNKNQMAGRKTILHRITIVGKLRNNEDNKSRVGEYYERKFRALQQQQQQQQQQTPKDAVSKAPNVFQEKVTGVLIIYPTLMIHVIESSVETIKDILIDLNRICRDRDGMITEAKILNFAHEVHVRLFPAYMFKILNLSIEYDASEPQESVDSLVTDIIMRLLRMGKFFNDHSRNHVNQSRKEIIDSLHETHPEFFPNQNYANYLLKNADLLPPDEYLSYHKKPINIILESELTWPAPGKLFPYQ